MQGLRQKDSDKTVLLKNVSVISLDTERNRLVFNFMNNIFVFGRWTPDYHYFPYNTTEEAIEAFEKIKAMPYFRLNYFISESSENLHIVNKDAVTTLSVKEDEWKIIFNLNFSITSYKDNKPIEISKFVFWTYNDEDLFDDDRFEISELVPNIEEI
jgi:hypothetical protein